MSNSDILKSMGHRAYVGMIDDPEIWYGVGKLQYHFLIRQGLKPHHKFWTLPAVLYV